jgi:hypothetical protein
MSFPAEPHHVAATRLLRGRYVVPPIFRYAPVRFRQTDDRHFSDIKPPLGISTLGSRRLGDAWGSRLTICMVATRALTAAGGDYFTPPDALGAILRSAKT